MKKLKQIENIEQTYQHLGSDVTLRTKIPGMPGVQEVLGKLTGLNTDNYEFYVKDDTGKEYNVNIGDNAPSMTIHSKEGSLVLNKFTKTTSIEDKVNGSSNNLPLNKFVDLIAKQSDHTTALKNITPIYRTDVVEYNNNLINN